MLDDLRNSATGTNDPTSPPPFQEETPSTRRRRQPFLGMTPVQRFILALLLFMMTCVVGVGCLVLTGKVYLPM
jgi:hypothetical protein